MTNPIWGFLNSLVDPVVKLVDELHTSDEERAQIKAEVFSVQAKITEKVLDYERTLLTSQAQIVTAEAKGESWLQRSWRPITMLTFLFLVVCDSFGLLAFRLADQAWTLLQVGLGGYVIGRSVEKAAPSVKNVLNNIKKTP